MFYLYEYVFVVWVSVICVLLLIVFACLQAPNNWLLKQDKDKQVYSLTARSIPRQFRQELKNQDESSLNSTQVPLEESFGKIP